MRRPPTKFFTVDGRPKLSPEQRKRCLVTEHAWPNKEPVWSSIIMYRSAREKHIDDLISRGYHAN